MPIRPEMRARYPADWKAIRARILARAGHRCEQCGVPNGAFRPSGMESWTLNRAEAQAWDQIEGLRVARVVLTVAHVHDPDPANCDPGNLAAWCQRCHNRHDAPMRARNAANTRRRKREAAGQGRLFNEG